MKKLWGSEWAEYKPKRWLERERSGEDSDKWRNVARDLFSYPVFQAGPRICLGKEMAYLQMKRVVGVILTRFTVVPAMLEGMEPQFFGLKLSFKFAIKNWNSLTGRIPYQLGGLQKLEQLQLSTNNLTGEILMSIWNPTYLTYLAIAYNNLEGSIPEEIGHLKNLTLFATAMNTLSSALPSSLYNLSSLTVISLAVKHLNINRLPYNMFSTLPNLEHLTIGSTLIDLQNISSLQYLNVSFNMFDSEVPIEGVFSNRCERNKNSSSTSPRIEQFSKVSYQNLHITTEGFSTNNLIGSGSYGSIYKGRLESEDKIAAIKVLDLQKKGAQKIFISECNALKNIRHQNLVKILTCCSGIDYKGQEFKALVFEYMSNGSLEKWLHPNEESAYLSTLDICQRFNVIYDVASALCYLHYEDEQPVVHCDLKPSNVLLDDDVVAHVSDFGLARPLATLNGHSQKQTSTFGIKGTIGYAPPEYGISSGVSKEGDVYSFGILILEMLTRKILTDQIFEDGHNLHSYVKAVFPNNLLEIVDKAVLPHQIPQTISIAMEEIRTEEPAHMHPNHERTLISLFDIGLACSVQSLKEGMNMMGVLKELNQIKNALGLRGRSQN
ncbi:probable LRR receptor-like serine/threonine-protein kinase At3g47570 [Neltuma alba]|uniref:probable LRR receptor-like serine/threonine-protein kinase At3g47570 n=1 Tax=Neltuma alba TaxID=207710 RepID=UPI0010A4875B|nr:probable LRR receptor-like serine/threonine-protein kinase At3g47570 [Prosopis alba]